MHFLNVEEISLVAGLLLQAGLSLLLIRKRFVRVYPIFVIYLLLNMVEDPLSWLLGHSVGESSPAYFRFYIAVTMLDYVLQLLIVLEIGLNVVRPSKRSLPFPVWPLALVGVLVCTIVATAFSPQVQLSSLSHAGQLFLRVTLGLAVLKLLLFAALAAFAQFLGIGWKNHVLQLASGLAFYGAASLFVQMRLSHLQNIDRALYFTQYVRLNQFQSAAYNATLIFWLWAFSRNEAPRKDFTPQMQQVLVTIAATARRTRWSVTRSGDQR